MHGIIGLIENTKDKANVVVYLLMHRMFAYIWCINVPGSTTICVTDTSTNGTTFRN